LAADNPKAHYFNCENRKDVEELFDVFCCESDATVLVDEVQKLETSEDWAVNLSLKAEENPSFKVVISGFHPGHMSQITHIKRMGEHKSIRMPMLTYLEYLHLTGSISSYDIDLKKVEYGNIFQDFMILKNLENMRPYLIGLQQIEESAEDLAIALANSRYSTSLLGENANAIFMAYLLLTLKLIENWAHGTVFSNRSKFSAYEAYSSLMSGISMSQSIRFLLWSEIGLCNQQVDSYNQERKNILVDLYFGKEKEFAELYLKELFTEGTIDACNPAAVFVL
jgi:hypothetical protein